MMDVLGVVVMVTVTLTLTEDLTHSDELAGFQIRYHCASSGEKTEICVHDCDDDHGSCRRLDVDVYRFLTADTVRQLA